MNKNLTILGLGNELLKDDGIGPRIIDELQKAGLPDGVEAIKVGGSFYAYWEVLERSKNVLVVDSLQGGRPPGSIYLLRASDIVQDNEPELFRHEDDFLGMLNYLKRYGVNPEVIILGVEPKEITYSLELSLEVKTKIPKVIKIIRRLCFYSRP